MHTNIHIIEVPEGKDREKRAENICEDIIAGKLPEHRTGNSEPSLGKQRVPGNINPRWNTLKHIVIKLTKIKHKDKILKVTREK